MGNGKVTLAELRAEAFRRSRAHGDALPDLISPTGEALLMRLLTGKTSPLDGPVMAARRRMLKLLRALHDGALKEG